jgi:urease accessory protein
MRDQAAVGGGSQVEGRAEIGFVHRGGRSRLAHLYQRDPLRVLFPAPPPGELDTAVLVTTSGGLVAGDRLGVAVELGPEARLHATAQAAEKVYRSERRETRIELSLVAAERAWLEWLPPETIVFDGARLRRTARVELAPGAGFLGGDILVLGRIARGERFTAGLLHDAWELRRGGRLVWADALHLAGDLPKISAEPACLDGAVALATLILADADAAKALGPARDCIAASGVRGGATLPADGVLVARFLSSDPAALRRAYAALAARLRALVRGLPERLPRLWHV